MNENKFVDKEEVYDKARPSYPREAIRYILQEVDYQMTSEFDAPTVADIGCGTGKLAAELQLNDCVVYGVEPNEEMLKIADRHLGPVGFCGGCDFIPIKASAENTTLPDGSMDFVTVAQALHWFDIEKFRTECNRILKPNGKVFVLYNKFNGILADKYAEFLKRQCPKFKGLGGDSEEKIKQFFSEGYAVKTFQSQVVYDRDMLVARALSSSYTPRQGDKDYGEFIAALHKCFDAHQSSGKIIFENITSVYHAKSGALHQEEVVHRGQLITVAKPIGDIKQVLICVHGLGGSKESTAISNLMRELPKVGTAVMAFDLPQHGKNYKEGELLSFDECISVFENVEACAREVFAGVPIFIFATSFGAYLTLYCMSQSKYDFKSVILRAPAVHMAKIYADLSNEGIIPDNPELESILIQTDLPRTFLDKGDNFFSIIQGKMDELVDWRSVEFFFNQRCKGKHKFYFFENADHRFTHDGDIEKITEIVKEVLS